MNIKKFLFFLTYFIDYIVRYKLAFFKTHYIIIMLITVNLKQKRLHNKENVKMFVN